MEDILQRLQATRGGTYDPTDGDDRPLTSHSIPGRVNRVAYGNGW